MPLGGGEHGHVGGDSFDVAGKRLGDQLPSTWQQDDEGLATVRRMGNSTDQSRPLASSHQSGDGSPRDEEFGRQCGGKQAARGFGEELHEKHPLGVGEPKPREVDFERGIRIPRNAQQLEQTQQGIGVGAIAENPLDARQLGQLSKQQWHGGEFAAGAPALGLLATKGLSVRGWTRLCSRRLLNNWPHQRPSS